MWCCSAALTLLRSQMLSSLASGTLRPPGEFLYFDHKPVITTNWQTTVKGIAKQSHQENL